MASQVKLALETVCTVMSYWTSLPILRGELLVFLFHQEPCCSEKPGAVQGLGERLFSSLANQVPPRWKRPRLALYLLPGKRQRPNFQIGARLPKTIRTLTQWLPQVS